MSADQLQNLAEKLDRAADVLTNVARLRLLPRNVQLLTAKQVMEILQVGMTRFYELDLPRYVNGRVVRYRLSDLPAHIEAHMQTADGRPLEKRPMKRRSPTNQPS